MKLYEIRYLGPNGVPGVMQIKGEFREEAIDLWLDITGYNRVQITKIKRIPMKK